MGTEVRQGSFLTDEMGVSACGFSRIPLERIRADPTDRPPLR